MASITTSPLTFTQERLLVQPIERTFTTHGIRIQVWDSSRYISKYEPLFQISSIKKTDPYWVYKSMIACFENEPKRYVVSIKIRITPLNNDEQQVKAIWDEVMHERIYEYLASPTNFTAPRESFEERITSWTKDDEKDFEEDVNKKKRNFKPELIKATRVRLDKKAQSSISPPKFVRTLPGKQIVRPSLPNPVEMSPLNPEKERKESKTEQQLEHSCILS